MNALLTDLYQLTMAAGYYTAGKHREIATFELFVRRLPYNRNYYLAAGLAQAVDYLFNLRFTAEEIAWLRGLPQFARAAPGFFDYLAQLRFTGDLFGMAEGTPVFPNEPILTVRAPLIEAQLVETYLLATIGFETLIATKAARIVEAAGAAAVVEFGARRAHGPESGVLAARAAYIGGCAGSSNVEAGFRFGIPVYGTSAHSWVMSFSSESESFRQLQHLLGEGTIYLIDSYDTLAGARKAAALGRPIAGVRLDSGNLFELSRGVRTILNQAGLADVKIMATSDLNEYRILELTAAAAPIDLYGVGTDLATSADSPSLGAVYKLVELASDGVKRYTAKYSEEKHTRPGAKQVFRYPQRDLIACAWECPPHQEPAEALLRPVIAQGQLLEPLPGAHAARRNAQENIKRLPHVLRSLYAPEEHPWRVDYSPELLALDASVRHNLQEAAP
jgi:nicotinate phosphoribosyltransferase